ncbi:hypothetical protein [Micromonospora radicis]|uniref:hypothetical protein n=1 Tax=Micromonospora radicis TaxID=1894971 RepID=UPI0011C4663F|nr:hypothetical protein [Micromonospora radicis]
MAKHRAPVDDLWSWEEGTGRAAPRSATNLNWPARHPERPENRPAAPRQDRAGRRPAPRQDPTESGPDRTDSWPAPRQDRSGGWTTGGSRNTAGVLGRGAAVGVARVPATSRLTPPGREIRNAGPRSALTRRPAGAPTPADRVGAASDPER